MMKVLQTLADLEILEARVGRSGGFRLVADPTTLRVGDVAFWASVLLASGQYLGNPLETHRTIPGIGPEHFDRWLELLREVVHEVFVEHVTGHVLVRAERMRVVLERHAGGPAR